MKHTTPHHTNKRIIAGALIALTMLFTSLMQADGADTRAHSAHTHKLASPSLAKKVSNKQKKCVPAKTDSLYTLSDVINRQEAGGSIPADPNSAVGPEQIITTVNSAVAIHDKKTGERLSLTPEADFWKIVPPSIDSANADPVVLFDEFTQRFVALLWERVGFNADAELLIELPEIIAGNYPASKGSNEGSQAPFDLRGVEIVLVDNIVDGEVVHNADTTVINDLTGKIALIASDNFATPSSTKGNNAANAGAVAAIIYNSEENLLISIFGSDVIPTISIGKDLGEAIIAQMIANPPVIGGMRNLAITEIGINSYSRMHLAVSKNATPKTADDFFTYVVGEETGPYKNLLSDYEKMGIDESAIYISSNSYEFPKRSNSTQNEFSQIVAVEKAPLIAGNGPVNVLLNDLILINPNDNVDKFFNSFATLRLPTLVHIPKSNTQQVAFFVNPLIADVTTGPQDGDKLIVTAVSEILSGSPKIATFTVPVEPWQASSSGFPPNFDTPGTNVQQPAGVFQELFGDPLYRLDSTSVVMMFRCVLSGDSLWCTHSVGGPDLFEIRWYELDISTYFDLANPRITLKQQGRIVPGGTTSAFYPSIDVDKDGNMGIGFNISGPEQPVAIAHTGRLKNDPQGTVRFPLQVNFVAQPEFPYYDGSQDFGFPVEDFTFASRWNDYISCVLDPADHKTFWVTSQYSNLDPVEYLETFSPNWKVGFVNFRVDKGEGDVKTKPAQKGCPSSGIDTSNTYNPKLMKAMNNGNREKRKNIIQSNKLSGKRYQ